MKRHIRRTPGIADAPRAMIRRAVGAVCLTLVAASGHAQQPLTERFTVRTGLENPNPILAVDLFRDEVPEIVASDVRGQLMIFDARNGQMLLGIQNPDGAAYSAPVTADFSGDQALEIAVGTGDGAIHLYNARLMPVASAQISTSDFAVPMTVVYLPDPEEIRPEIPVLIAPDQNSTVYALYLDANGSIQSYWAPVRTGATITNPVTAGRVRSSDRVDLIVPTSNGQVVLIDALNGEPSVHTVKENQRIVSMVLPVDMNGNGRDELVMSLASGEIQVRRYEPANRRLVEERAILTRNEPVGDPVLVKAPDAPDIQGLIFQVGRDRVVALNLARGVVTIAEERTFAGGNTQLTQVPRGEVGYPSLVHGISNSVRIMTTAEWFRDQFEMDYPRLDIGEPLSNSAVVVGIPESDNRDVFRYHLVGLTTSGRLVGLRSEMTYRPSAGARRSEIAPWLSPWMTRGGSPLRSGRIELPYFERETARQRELVGSFEAKTREWQAAMDAGDFDAALQAAAWRRDRDPFSEQYLKEYRQTWIRKNLMMLILAGIGGLLVLGVIALVLGRVLWLHRLERSARLAVAGGQMDKAEELYERLLKARGNKPKIVATLAMVYISNKNFSAKTIPIYKQALESEPGNQNLVLCHARALLDAAQFDAEARSAYTAALKLHPEPQVLEYAIGLCWKNEGNMDEAAKSLRAALRAGHTANPVYAALCDVYLATDNRTAKALPIYKQQFSSRQQDAKFLAVYLDACIDAKQTDSTVESLCHMVLEENPDHVPAYTQLATILMQKSEPGRAAEEVRRALSIDPANPTARALFAQICLVDNRTDDEARGAYEAALELNPKDADLLRVLAEIYFKANNYDAHAVAIYRRSHEVNPKDPTTLKALAKTAELTADHPLTVRSIESLIEIGAGNAQLSQQLAGAYIALGTVEPRTEKILREAFRNSPDNPDLARGLARVLVAQQKEDADVIPFYEAHMGHNPSDREVGTMLVRAYAANDRYADALARANDLLGHHPDDEELKRLVALSSLYDNKVDEAVKEYEAILARNPSDTEAVYHLAMAYAQKGRIDEKGQQFYERALASRQSAPELSIALARCLLARKETIPAIEALQAMLRADPESSDQLVRFLEQVLNEQPDNARLRWLLCETLVTCNHHKSALDQLELIFDKYPNQARNIMVALDSILAKDPNYSAALVMKAKMMKSTGDLTSACGVLEEVRKNEPGNDEANRALVDAYEKRLADKDDLEIRFQLGRMYFFIGEYDKAIAQFQKTNKDYRYERNSARMLGKCFVQRGMLEYAYEEYKKVTVDDEIKELLYDLAQRFEAKRDLVGAKNVYKTLYAADVEFRDVGQRYHMLEGSTSDPLAMEKTSIVQEMSEEAKRRYEVLDELGRGAMGIVYRARDKELEEVVALKILPDSMSNNPEAVRRFKIEARNARKLSHPHIVRIHDIGEELGRKYISMEYVDGSDLKKKIREGGPLSHSDFITYGLQIADALAYAHRLGIVHRDIKPANMMLNSNNEVKITDFGIAKMLDQAMGEGEQTMVGAVIGTPLYMSPEQFKGLPVDNRADVYAYGVMLYEFANGKPPFTQGDLAYHHLHTPVPRPENVPDELWAIIEKCMAKEKEDRYENAEEVIEDLKKAREAMA